MLYKHFLVSFLVAYSEIISESSVEKCYQNDDLNCSEKLLISLTLENGQVVGSEQIQITSTKNNSILETPITITITKSPVLALYPLTYVQDFNSQPLEQVIQTSQFICDDDYYSSSPTCGYATDSNGKKIPYSQGYCCQCSLTQTLGLNNDQLNRGMVCQALNIGPGSATAHCLKFSPIWYSAFTIDQYQIYYEISIVISFNSTYNQTLSLGSQLFTSQSNNKLLIGRLIGDFSPLSPPPVLSDLYLMKPSRPLSNARVLEGSRAWMFLTKNLVTLDGSECNKVGVGYQAFQNEANQCSQIVGSCLKNQIENFYQDDLTKISQNTTPSYLISSKGDFKQVTDSTKTYLSYNVNGKMPSLITLEIDAKEVRFISNVGNGTIDFANISNFEAHSGNGQLNLQISNTGNLDSEFSLSLNCSSDVQPSPGWSVYLKPYQSQKFTKNVQVYSDTTQNNSCIISLFNNEGDLLDQKYINFSTTAIVYQNQQNNGTENQNATEQSQQPIKNTPNCTDICPQFWDFVCFFKNGCSQQTYRFFTVLISSIFIIICLCCIIKHRKQICKKKKKKIYYQTSTDMVNPKEKSIQKQNETIRQDSNDTKSIFIQPKFDLSIELHQETLYANFNGEEDFLNLKGRYSIPLIGTYRGFQLIKLKVKSNTEFIKLCSQRYGVEYQIIIKKILSKIMKNQSLISHKPLYPLI